MKLYSLVNFLNKYLNIENIQDESQNGLQVHTNQNIKRIGFAVDASLLVFRLAKKEKCDLVIVHHGLFWSKPYTLTGLSYERIKFLIENRIGVYAVHLPLDYHKKVGNNVQIAKSLGLKVTGEWGKYSNINIGISTQLPKSMSLKSFTNLVKKKLKCIPHLLAYGKKMVKTVGICSGGGASLIDKSKEEGHDVYLTGETSHTGFNLARDYKMNVIF